MASDATTFFWSFLAIFGGLGWYLWHLERKVDALARQVETAAANLKRDDGDGGDTA